MRDMNIRLGIVAVALALGLALAPGDAGAFRGGDDDPPAAKAGAAEFAAGKKAVDAGEYRAALDNLAKAVEADPNNADAFNLLGFSYRKLGDVEMAFEHYRQALRLEPRHRGANEYVGELYLETGDLAKAEEHLRVLGKACFFGCRERTELKQAVAAYRASHGG